MPSIPSTPTESQKAILPKDKHDDTAIAHISTLPESSVAPLIPELLTWFQDINWPIAMPTKSLLLKYPHLLVAPVLQVLLGDDDEWKHNCLAYIVDEMPREQQRAFRPVVERIAKSPTTVEKEDYELDVIARDILEKLDGID